MQDLDIASIQDWNNLYTQIQASHFVTNMIYIYIYIYDSRCDKN